MTRLPSGAASVLAIRPAAARDADSIARIFLESAAYHAGLDAVRYGVPDVESIVTRYREKRQHPQEPGVRAVTLVAELSTELVGFVDARLERSQDPMHREMTYCHVFEPVEGGHRRKYKELAYTAL